MVVLLITLSGGHANENVWESLFVLVSSTLGFGIEANTCDHESSLQLALTGFYQWNEIIIQRQSIRTLFVICFRR